MAQSKHTAIAEAVKDSLNTGTFVFAVVAQRKYPGAAPLREVDVPEVFVFPIANEWEYISRANTAFHDYGIQVVVRARLTVTDDEYDQAEFDNLLKLLEDIQDHLRDAGQMSGATLIAGESEPIFEPDKLDENLFFSIQTFQYRIGRKA